MSTKRKDLTKGNITQTLKTLTIPMVFGLLGFVIFNLVDTYYVSKLGTDQMAALTFTFPVVLVLNSLNLGIGIGASAIISRAVGEKNQDKVVRLSTDSLSLGVLFATIAMIIGFSTITPLFKALGADAETMIYIKKYMYIWYAGVPFVVIPMIGNNAIRALGDTKTPSIVMMVSAGVNIVLDPILIFGFAFIPAMGVQGAALATVFSRFITFTFALYVLIYREKVISLKVIHFKELIASWGEILYIGLPNAISKMIMPIGVGIITGLIAGFGNSSVAAFGISSRMEYFALILVSSLSAIIPVFVGQNLGAGCFDRIAEGLKSSVAFSVINGVSAYVVFFIIARPLASLFTKDQAVVDTVVLYLRIAPIGFAFQGIILIATNAFNALRRPIRGAAMNLSQMLLLYVPLSILLSRSLGIKGVFIAYVISNCLTAIIAYFELNRIVKKISHK